MSVLNINNLNFRYPQQGEFILNDINLEIDENDFVGIVGANGSGKSTLLKLILNFLTPSSGDITYWGKSLNEVRNRIGYLSQFEDVDFNFPITLFEIVLSGRIESGYINKYTKEDKVAVEEVMNKFEIWDMKDSTLDELSGGQKQRVFLSRALVNNPDLLILDEPLASLDIKTQSSFYHMLKELNEDMTILVVDHNLEMLTKYVNKVVCVDKCEHDTVKLHGGNLENLLNI